MDQPEPLDKIQVVCVCQSPDHILQFVASEDPESETVVWVNVQLHQHRSFRQRAWVALRYLFGYECRYGHWDCTDLTRPEAHKLQAFLNKQLA